MRCNEARNRIDQPQEKLQSDRPDRQLADHLDSCSRCHEYAQASDCMGQLLNVAGNNLDGPRLPLEAQRQQVEARIRKRDIPRRPYISGALNRLAWLLASRPAVRWSGGLVTVALLAFALVPFSSYSTVGYDLRLDGVDFELAQGNDQLCELLDGLGLVEAFVDQCGCDATTCCLSIFDLKTEEEAELVAGAIGRLHDEALTSLITPIRAKATRTLLERASDIFKRGSS